LLFLIALAASLVQVTSSKLISMGEVEHFALRVWEPALARDLAKPARQFSVMGAARSAPGIKVDHRGSRSMRLRLWTKFHGASAREH
jgi:hypothetical protein